eukprot:CCRYP_001752-RA/>CCRYP_001752-RA protein AED:0.28 eAED:0.27 QI:0/0/0/1/0/0/2/0/118
MPNQRKQMFDYKFGGPIGALTTMIFLPLVTLLLTYWASIGKIKFANILPSSEWCSSGGSYSFLCFGFGLQVLLEQVLPDEIVHGVLLPDGLGKRLPYQISDHLAFWVTLLLLNVGWPC